MRVKYQRVGGVCGAVVEVPTPGTPGKVIVTAAGDDLATSLHAAALVAERVASDPVMRALMPRGTLRNIQVIKDLAAAALDSPEAIRDAMDGLTGEGRRRLARALHTEALDSVNEELGITVTGGDASRPRSKSKPHPKGGAPAVRHVSLPNSKPDNDDDDDDDSDDGGGDDGGDDGGGYGDNTQGGYPQGGYPQQYPQNGPPTSPYGAQSPYPQYPAPTPYQAPAPAPSSPGNAVRNSIRPLKLGDLTIGAAPSHGEWMPDYGRGGRQGKRIPLGDVVNSNAPEVGDFWDSVTDLASKGLDAGWKLAVAHRKEIAMAAAGAAFGPAGAVAAGKAVDLVAASVAAKTPAQKDAVKKAADQIASKAAAGDPKAAIMAHVIKKEIQPSAPKGDPHPDDEPHDPDEGHPDDAHAHAEHDGDVHEEDNAYDPLPEHDESTGDMGDEE